MATTGRKGVSVLKKFFGTLPGQSLAEFAEETKALSDQDFEAIRDGITDGSLTY